MKKLAASLCLLLSSCVPPSCNQPVSLETKQQLESKEFTYYKDEDTNLCFVLMDYKYSTMNIVECSASVENKVKERLNR